MKSYRIGLLLFLLFANALISKAGTITLPSEETVVTITNVYYLHDSASVLRAEQVISESVAAHFLFSSEENNGFRPEIKTVWLKFAVHNPDDFDGDWVFDFESWSLVDFYIAKNKKIEKHFKTGHLLPFRQRNYPVGNKNHILLPVKGKDTLQCFVRLQSLPDHTIIPLNLNFSVGSKSYVDAQNNLVKQIISTFIGILFVMFLYNFFVYWSTRDRSYLYYLVIVAGTIYMVLSNSGYVVSVFYFVESFPQWRGVFEAVVSGIAMIMMILFTMQLLNTRENIPFWHKVMKGFLWLILILTFGNNINFEVFGPIIFLSTFLLMGTFITVGVLAVIRKIPSAPYYLLAYSFSAAGIVILSMMYTGVLPRTNFTAHYALPLGYSLEIVFFSLALANMINLLKRENEEKQEKIISQLQENEKLQTKVNRELETKVIERTQEIRRKSEIIELEKEKSEQLLLNILPASTAQELKTSGKASTKSYKQISVLFSDFKDFTTISEKFTPDELVHNLDICFQEFDDIMSKYNLEKIKTIGDSYMCADGVPNNDYSDPTNIVLAGLEMQEFISNWNKDKKRKGEQEWPMRIGIHTGPITAGVVGKKKFSYDIWGDTVNLAARLESSGEVGKVNVSEFTMKLITERFEFRQRGKISAKNKGMVDMYFVEKPIVN